MTFNDFDKSVRTNEFWELPIDRINQNLERNRKKDALLHDGVSLVYGCPLPENVLDSIRAMRRAFDRVVDAHGSSAKVMWRSNDSALHLSVYGLVMPDDYVAGKSWPMTVDMLGPIQSIADRMKGLSLHLQGIGILGMGAVSIRVSDSPELDTMRDAISKVGGVSHERFGSRTKKVVIGRLLSPLTNKDRAAIRAACVSLHAFHLGTVTLNELSIIHYKNTLLDAEYERVKIGGHPTT